VRVAFKAIHGVENVNVSLNKGLADVDFKPGNTVTFKQLQDAIAKNGFTTKQSSVVVRGTVESVNGKYLLKVNGTPDSFELEGDRSQLQTLSGKQVQVEVQGTLPEAPQGKLPDKIQVSKMEETK
jgi:hypothetical protein